MTTSCFAHLVVVLFTYSIKNVVSYPYLRPAIRAPAPQTQYNKIIQEISNKHPLLHLDPHSTNYHNLGDGTVVAYGEKFQLVSVPVMGVNRLIPLTLQYAIRIPELTLNTKSSNKNNLIRNGTTYSQEGKSKQGDVNLGPPTSPNIPATHGSINFLPLIDNRLFKTLKKNQGNSFVSRPSLGQVPVVHPGSVRPFALFWYLPVNPQIQIDDKEVVKDDKRVHTAINTPSHNPIYTSYLGNAPTPIYHPKLFRPISSLPYSTSRNRQHHYNVLH